VAAPQNREKRMYDTILLAEHAGDRRCDFRYDRSIKNTGECI